MGEGGPFVKFTLPLRSDSRLSPRITAFIRFSLVLMRLLMLKFIKVVYFFCPLSSRTFASIIILSSESLNTGTCWGGLHISLFRALISMLKFDAYSLNFFWARKATSSRGEIVTVVLLVKYLGEGLHLLSNPTILSRIGFGATFYLPQTWSQSPCLHSDIFQRLRSLVPVTSRDFVVETKCRSNTSPCWRDCSSD